MSRTDGINMGRSNSAHLADPPRLDGWFWLYHVLGWLFFIVTNIVMRVMASVEGLTHAIVSGVIMPARICTSTSVPPARNRVTPEAPAAMADASSKLVGV